MNLHFVHPWMAWGALLAGVPILIHLLHRRRARRMEFAAIALVLSSQQRNARRLRLKRLVLLALRTLLCLAIPLGLARPYLAPDAVPTAAGGNGPAVVVVVLDTSMSMRYRLGETTLFARARSLAEDALSGLSPEDTVAVLPCADGVDGPLPTASFDVAEARQVIRAAKVSWRGTDMNACLVAVSKILTASPLPGKKVVVVSDLTQNAWHQDVPPPTVTVDGEERRPEVRLVDAAGGEPLPNRWVEGLEVAPAVALGPRGYAFSFSVRASEGTEAGQLAAELRTADETLAQGFVEVTPGGVSRKTLSHPFPKGGDIVGEIAIDADNLPEDDRAAFTTFVRKDVRALVVDGDPRVNRYEDEVFFVERALSPGRSGSQVRPSIVDVDGFATTPLEGYDVVLLLNVHALPAGKGTELDAFVRGGGGLFIGAGERLDPDAYNRDLAPLLPAELHLAKTAEANPASLAGVEWAHPIFQVFTGEGREGFSSARFTTWLLTRPPAKDARIIASYDDGSPALLVRPYGEGRVGLLTTSVDTDWTNLATRTAFLPLMQQVTGFLARALEENRDASHPLGQPRTIKVPVGVTALRIDGPEKQGAGFKGEALGEGELVFSSTWVPGVYRVETRRGEGEFSLEPGLSFVVRADAAESDTTRADMDALLAWLGAEAQDEASLALASVAGSGGDGEPLWTWLLVLAAVALVAEGALLRR